ncbi:unnamed protein product [Angiostrongylus costaricensis]|uniref:non-specific serine/threonine protein kinase n=1 Tax=Angiostrongylus costaricensis TaxID=334426 RepID=A0A158PD87_ANGCS|nr:unnamed protein product [Angiostrongylus costaricensis]
MPSTVSQSRIGGRSAPSNACTVIAVRMAEVIHRTDTRMPTAIFGKQTCPHRVISCLVNAILDGNSIHEEAVRQRANGVQNFTIPDAIRACKNAVMEVDFCTVPGPLNKELPFYISAIIKRYEITNIEGAVIATVYADNVGELCHWLCLNIFHESQLQPCRTRTSGSDSGSDSVITKEKKTEVLPVAAKKPVMPGALVKSRHQPKWYNVEILREERPDLFGADGKMAIEREEAALMDMFIRDKSDLQTGDLIITDDNLDEEDRHFNRYEVQLKYNEGSNETQEKGTLYAMKIGIRPNSANITLRMKRELRVLNDLRKCKCPFAPIVLDSGRVADLPFIVMNLLDRNLEKLREQIKVFKPALVFYIAMEAMSALGFLHSLKYIHRDVKLTNICIGAGPATGRIYLIDYGDAVKQGKKIRYGTPDVFTLPYWSLDAHKRSAAHQRGDAESWFYMIADLLSPGCLPWYRMSSEAEVQAAKAALWKEGGQRLTENLHIHMLQEVVRTSGENFDHHLARTIARDGIISHLKGPLMLDWAPNVCVNIPVIQQKIFDQKKVKLAILKKKTMKELQNMERSVGLNNAPSSIPTGTKQGVQRKTKSRKSQTDGSKSIANEPKSLRNLPDMKADEARSVRRSSASNIDQVKSMKNSADEKILHRSRTKK